MSLWRTRDEKALRRALRRHIKPMLSVRKKFFKAPKAACYKPVRRALAVSMGLLSLCILPGIIIQVASQLPRDSDIDGAIPFALAWVAWLASGAVLSRSWGGIEAMLFVVMPLRADRAFSHALRGGCLSALLVPAAAILAVFGVLLVRPGSAPGLAPYTWHFPAMLLTIPFCMKLRRWTPPFVVPFVLLALCAVTVFRCLLPNAVGSLESVLVSRALLPNGWVSYAIQAFREGNTGHACTWLALMLPTSVLAVLVVLAERRLFITTLETAEPDDEAEEASADVPTATGWDGAGWVERLVQTFVPDEQHPVLELMRGGSFDWTRRWRRGLCFAAAGGVMALLPHPLWQWVGAASALIGVLDATPALGGGWPGLQTFLVPHGTAYILSVFPVSFARAASAAWRSNVIRCVVASPQWGLFAWATGRAIHGPVQTLHATALLWLTIVAWLHVATLLNMTQHGVGCVRGRWWRLPLSVTILLGWLVHAIGAAILAVTTAVETTPLVAWGGAALMMIVTGAIMARFAVHQVAGPAFDHLAKLPANQQ